MDFIQIYRKNLYCPVHKKETVTRVSIKVDAPKHVFCIECLMDLTGFDKENIIPFGEFIDRASDFYEKASKSVKKDEDLSQKYQGVLNAKFERISELVAHFEEEKKKVEAQIEILVLGFQDFMKKKKEEYWDMLDRQLITFQSNYDFFEKQINKLSGNTAFPTRYELLNMLETVKDPDQLLQYVKTIKSEMSEQKILADSNNALGDLSKKIQEMNKLLPTLSAADNFDYSAVLADIEQSVAPMIDSVFKYNNDIISIQKIIEVTDSKILSGNDFVTISKWVPNQLKYKKMVQLYNSEKHSKSAYEMNTRIKDKKNIVIVYKSNINEVFGGFMGDDFSKYSSYFIQPNAFLFSITRNRKYDSKLGTNTGWADQTSWGPCFGGDLYVNLSTNQGYCAANPTAYQYNNANEFIGGTNFTCTNLEIYTFE